MIGSDACAGAARAASHERASTITTTHTYTPPHPHTKRVSHHALNSPPHTHAHSFHHSSLSPNPLIDSFRFTPPKQPKPRQSRSIAQVRVSKGVVSSERARVLQPPGRHPRHPGQDPLHQDHPTLTTHPLQRRRHALRPRLPRRGLDYPHSHATPRHATPRISPALTLVFCFRHVQTTLTLSAPSVFDP